MSVFMYVCKVMDEAMLKMRRAVQAVATTADAFEERLSSDDWMDLSHQCKPSSISKLC
jgi:hypothetical protein